MSIILSGIVIIGLEKLRRPKSVQPGNHKWITIIQAIKPFIISAGQNYLANWHKEPTLPRN